MNFRSFHALKRGRFILSFSLFMLLIFTHCSRPQTSGIPCFSFSQIAYHPPLPVCRLVNDRIVTVWACWTCMSLIMTIISQMTAQKEY